MTTRELKKRIIEQNFLMKAFYSLTTDAGAVYRKELERENSLAAKAIREMTKHLEGQGIYFGDAETQFTVTYNTLYNRDYSGVRDESFNSHMGGVMANYGVDTANWAQVTSPFRGISSNFFHTNHPTLFIPETSGFRGLAIMQSTSHYANPEVMLPPGHLVGPALPRRAPHHGGRAGTIIADSTATDMDSLELNTRLPLISAPELVIYTESVRNDYIRSMMLQNGMLRSDAEQLVDYEALLGNSEYNLISRLGQPLVDNLPEFRDLSRAQRQLQIVLADESEGPEAGRRMRNFIQVMGSRHVGLNVFICDLDVPIGDLGGDAAGVTTPETGGGDDNGYVGGSGEL